MSDWTWSHVGCCTALATHLPTARVVFEQTFLVGDWRRSFEVPAPQAANSVQELQTESGTSEMIGLLVPGKELE
jgi:hypothetical protein